MPIDRERFRFLAIDGQRAIWTYPTENVSDDLVAMRRWLVSPPTWELITSAHGISIWFRTTFIFSLDALNISETLNGIGATIARIPTTIIDEGTNPTVAPKGKL